MVRPATVDDADAIAVVQTRTSREVYRGVMPPEHLAGLDPARRGGVWRQIIGSGRFPAGTLVLEHPDEGVVGFVDVAPSWDPDTDPGLTGEVRAIYVLPEHQGRGGGRLLMEAGLRRLADAGRRQVILWVLEANRQARRFYETAGWSTDGVSRTDDSRGIALVVLRYRLGDRAGPGLVS